MDYNRGKILEHGWLYLTIWLCICRSSAGFPSVSLSDHESRASFVGISAVISSVIVFFAVGSIVVYILGLGKLFGGSDDESSSSEEEDSNDGEAPKWIQRLMDRFWRKKEESLPGDELDGPVDEPVDDIISIPPEVQPEDNGRLKPPPLKGTSYGFGILHFTLWYDVKRAILKLKVKKAEDLIAKDASGTSDPFIEINFVPVLRECSFKTRVIFKELSPKWFEVFVFKDFPNSLLDRLTLVMNLFDYDVAGGNDNIGVVEYKLKPLYKPLVPIDSSAEQVEKVLEATDFATSGDLDNLSFAGDSYTSDWVARARPEIGCKDDNVSEKSYDEDEIEEKDRPNIVKRIRCSRYIGHIPGSRFIYGYIMLTLTYNTNINQLKLQVTKGQQVRHPTGTSLDIYVRVRQSVKKKYKKDSNKTDKEKKYTPAKTEPRYAITDPVWNKDFVYTVKPKDLDNVFLNVKIYQCPPNEKVLGQIRLGKNTPPEPKEHWLKMIRRPGYAVENWYKIRR